MLHASRMGKDVSEPPCRRLRMSARMEGGEGNGRMTTRMGPDVTQALAPAANACFAVSPCRLERRGYCSGLLPRYEVHNDRSTEGSIR